VNKTELKEALLKHNFHEALRVAVADLLNNENYEPFTGLALEGNATVGIRMDSQNNIHFYSVQQPEPETPEEYEPEIEAEKQIIEKPKPRRAKKL